MLLKLCTSRYERIDHPRRRSCRSRPHIQAHLSDSRLLPATPAPYCFISTMLSHGVTNISYAGTARVPPLRQQTLFQATRDALRPKQQCLRTLSSCRLAIVPAAAAAAAAQKHVCRSSSATLSPSSSSSSNGAAIELRRTLLMQQLQDVLPTTTISDMPSDNLPASSSSSRSSGGDLVNWGNTPSPSSSSSSSSGGGAGRQSSTSKRVKGFATGAGSSNSSRLKQQHGRQQQQHVAADDGCPCRSGLKHNDCCQPFLTGTAKPRSALELVSARFTAAKTGNTQYLVSTTHPDSSLTLGGAKDLAGRAKRLCAYFRKNKMEIVGMAHCPGDQSGTWVVLTILQATTGDFAGEKVPYMELIARRNWTDTKVTSNSHNKGLWGDDSAAAAGSSEDRGGFFVAEDWMYVGNMSSFPDNGQAEVLVQLVQRHCPAVLNSGSSGSDQQQQQQESMAERDVCFVWTAPNLHVGGAASSSSSSRRVDPYGSSSSRNNNPDGSSSSSSGGGWYVDLLKSSVESIGNRQQQQQPAAVSEQEYKQMINQHHLVVPPGVFIMDDYMELKGNK